MLMVKRRVVYAKSAVLSSPINKVLDLQKCVDCLRNYIRMYGCYLTQCVLYRVYWHLMLCSCKKFVLKCDCFIRIYLLVYCFIRVPAYHYSCTKYKQVYVLLEYIDFNHISSQALPIMLALCLMLLATHYA